MLEAETAFFEENKANWASSHPGKFALIKGSEALGFYDTRDEALVEGARRIGLTPFLVRNVTEPEEPVRIPAMGVGVLSANPPSAVQPTGQDTGRK